MHGGKEPEIGKEGIILSEGMILPAEPILYDSVPDRACIEISQAAQRVHDRLLSPGDQNHAADKPERDRISEKGN